MNEKKFIRAIVTMVLETEDGHFDWNCRFIISGYGIVGLDRIMSIDAITYGLETHYIKLDGQYHSGRFGDTNIYAFTDKFKRKSEKYKIDYMVKQIVNL